MFKREQHQRIAKVLDAFDGGMLKHAGYYLGGGTAISLALNEYRESAGVDFLCSSAAGYKFLRNVITDDLGKVSGQLTAPLSNSR